MKIYMFTHGITNNFIELFRVGKKGSKKHKTDKKGYYDLICTFDTETSVNQIAKDDKQFSYIILWQFCINNEFLIYGRDIHSYVEFINELNSVAKKQIIVYVHNLSYEFQFIKFYFTWDDIFFMQPRKIYKCKSENIIYRDSYALSGQSLEKTVAKYPIKKAVGKWDYDKIRTSCTYLSDDELEYAFNDVKSLYYYIVDMKKQYNKLENIPMTKTGITRYNLRQYLDNYYTYKPKFKTGLEYYYNQFIKHSAPDIDVYEKLQKVYWGGFTHANLFNSHKVLYNIASYDICSSYPTVMLCEKFPYKFYQIPKDRFNYYYKQKNDYSIIAFFRFYKLQSKIKMGYIPNYKVISKTNDFITDNGKIYKCYDEGSGILDIWLCELDLQTIFECYNFDKIEIISDNIYISKKHFLPDGYRNFILKLYADKTQLKGVEGQEENYMRAKADLNSLYGMTVTAPIRVKYKLENREVVEYMEDTPENLLDKAYKQHSHPIGLYQWGVWVAAYARRNILKIITRINSDDFVYSDTDSIKLKNYTKYESLINDYNDNITEKLKSACKDLDFTTAPATKDGVIKPLGVYEREFIAEKFKCLRSKTYIYTLNNKLHATVAGVAKNDIINYLQTHATTEQTIYDLFDDNLFMKSTDINKLTAIYIDEKHEDTVNGEHVESESCTLLRKSDFSIKGDDYYLRVLTEIQNYPYIV